MISIEPKCIPLESFVSDLHSFHEINPKLSELATIWEKKLTKKPYDHKFLKSWLNSFKIAVDQGSGGDEIYNRHLDATTEGMYSLAYKAGLVCENSKTDNEFTSNTLAEFASHNNSTILITVKGMSAVTSIRLDNEGLEFINMIRELIKNGQHVEEVDIAKKPNLLYKHGFVPAIGTEQVFSRGYIRFYQNDVGVMYDKYLKKFIRLPDLPHQGVHRNAIGSAKFKRRGFNYFDKHFHNLAMRSDSKDSLHYNIVDDSFSCGGEKISEFELERVSRNDADKMEPVVDGKYYVNESATDGDIKEIKDFIEAARGIDHFSDTYVFECVKFSPIESQVLTLTDKLTVISKYNNGAVKINEFESINEALEIINNQHAVTKFKEEVINKSNQGSLRDIMDNEAAKIADLDNRIGIVTKELANYKDGIAKMETKLKESEFQRNGRAVAFLKEKVELYNTEVSNKNFELRELEAQRDKIQPKKSEA